MMSTCCICRRLLGALKKDFLSMSESNLDNLTKRLVEHIDMGINKIPSQQGAKGEFKNASELADVLEGCGLRPAEFGVGKAKSVQDLLDGGCHFISFHFSSLQYFFPSMHRHAPSFCWEWIHM